MADFSCYIDIDNTEGLYPLELTKYEATFGTFVVPPPERIEAGIKCGTEIQLKDPTAVAGGSEGTIVYRLGYFDKDADECPNVNFWFRCPYSDDNSFTVSYDDKKNNLSNTYVTYEGAVTTNKANDYKSNSINPNGHPLYIRIKIKPVANGKQFLARMT